MVMKNYGTAMGFSGPGFELSVLDPSQDPNSSPRKVNYSATAFEMPSYFTLSTSYNLVQNAQSKVIALGAFQNNNFSGDNLRAGLEWTYRDMVALRGSYFGTFNGTIDQTTGDETFKFGSGDDLYKGFSLGAGFNTRLGDTSKVGVDFAWKPVQSGTFDDIYAVGVHLKF